MPTTSLDTGDAVELSEMLQLLSDWLAADPDPLERPLDLLRRVGDLTAGVGVLDPQ